MHKQSGGPCWEVELGRRDALTTSLSAATNAIPQPNFTVPQLIASFNAVGLDKKDVVALSGTFDHQPSNSVDCNPNYHSSTSN